MRTATKVEVVNQLSRTGLHRIEVTSFVSPRVVPALADAREVLAGIDRVPGVVYVALVPNVRGAEDAAAAPRRPDEVNAVVSASETHNRANINRSHAQSLSELAAMVAAAHGAGMKITMSLSTTFGCPFEGRVHEDVVLDFVGRFRELGFDGISLADTTGMANPRQVRELVAGVLDRFAPPNETYYTLHFHNTRGMGLANVVAGIEAGVRSFDGSVAGLGGCPFAPGATGNICTEDMVNMLEDMGYDTRIDLARLLAVARRIPAIVGHETPGQVMKAGQTLELHAPPGAAGAP
ncbi:MAG TPA: hydroxymethylglutaryl-CoA lyase [Myxococcota bacterium]|nr:hydroxymethylglutaryl-CoA lyase [Myxococcota bacterium]